MSEIAERLSPAPHGLVDRCARGVASLEEGEELRTLVQEMLARLGAAEEVVEAAKAVGSAVAKDQPGRIRRLRAALARLPAAGEELK